MTQLLGLVLIVAAAVGVLWILWNPRWAAVVILIMFPLEQLLQSYFPVLTAFPWAINIAVGSLAGFAVLVRVLKNEPITFGLLNATTVLLVVLYVMTWVGLLWSPNRSDAQGVLIRSIPYVALFLLVLPLLLEGVRGFRPIVFGVMVAGTAIALLILLNPASSYRAGRMTLDLGVFAGMQRTNPLALATMGSIIALAAVLVQYERSTTLIRVIRITAFLAGLGLAIGSGSRGQVLAAIGVGVVCYPIARQVANVKQFFFTVGGLGFLAIGFSFAFNLFISDVNRQRWDLSMMQSDLLGRWDMIAAYMAALLSSPSHWLLGLGTNAFPVIAGGSVLYPHNIIVEVVCELGLVGGAMLAGLTFCSLFAGIRLWRAHRDDPSLRSVTAFLIGMWVFMLLLGVKQGSFTLNPAAVMWWLVVARIAAFEEKSALLGAWAPWARGAEPDVDGAELGSEYDDEYALSG